MFFVNVRFNLQILTRLHSNLRIYLEQGKLLVVVSTITDSPGRRLFINAFEFPDAITINYQ